MSFYNANIKSREIEASFSSNQKVQIDIDDGVYLSDMVLTLTPVLSGTMVVDLDGGGLGWWWPWVVAVNGGLG